MRSPILVPVHAPRRAPPPPKPALPPHDAASLGSILHRAGGRVPARHGRGRQVLGHDGDQVDPNTGVPATAGPAEQRHGLVLLRDPRVLPYLRLGPAVRGRRPGPPHRHRLLLRGRSADGLREREHVLCGGPAEEQDRGHREQVLLAVYVQYCRERHDSAHD